MVQLHSCVSNVLKQVEGMLPECRIIVIFKSLYFWANAILMLKEMSKKDGKKMSVCWVSLFGSMPLKSLSSQPYDFFLYVFCFGFFYF